MLNLEEIKEEVIEEGYSELKSTRIDISWCLLPDGIMTYGHIYKRKWAGHIGYYIQIHPILKDAGVIEIRGGIAHEYSHIVKDASHTRKESLKDLRRYLRSQEYCRKDEICTDIETINRGFGYDLLTLELFLKKNLNLKWDAIPSSHLKEILAEMYNPPVKFTYKDYINSFGNGNGRSNGKNRC